MNQDSSTGDFWAERRVVNARQAIFHQWEQLEASGCFENFRIAAGESGSFRKGLFFADSDAYKWLDAASRIWAATQDPKLAALMDDLISLIGHAQEQDGYLFTFNQIHFPGTRWHNLQIEHELYCHGHLIEAGVSHYQATGRTDLLEIARSAADRVMADFTGKGPEYTPGHEEIEIALLRLQEVTKGESIPYLDLARQFIEQRGRTRHYGWLAFRQMMNMLQRMASVRKQGKAYAAAHPHYKPLPALPDNAAKAPGSASLRWISSILSGRYNQQHLPVREQAVPDGHSVRFGYLETAVARLSRQSGDTTYLPAVKQAWQHMVERRMYVTGGIGSLPLMEGFGNDYELDPEYAYAETCAALACLFWNWEMVLLTGEAKYSDLFEWQLYNAAGVGMGLEGKNYFYNNPLACRGKISRQPWYLVPCCPSNISRTWADLDRYTLSTRPGELTVHQYIGGQRSVTIPGGEDCAAAVRLDIQSGLPWSGRVRIEIHEISSPVTKVAVVLQLRRPSWAEELHVTVNGKPVADVYAGPNLAEPTASGYDPRQAEFYRLARTWSTGDKIEIEVDMPIRLRTAHPNVKGHAGKVAVTRGPLVYCLESVDHPDVNIFSAQLDPTSLIPFWDGSRLGGCTCIHAKTGDGQPLVFVPYFLWGNRGSSQMTVWVNH